MLAILKATSGGEADFEALEKVVEMPDRDVDPKIRSTRRLKKVHDALHEEDFVDRVGCAALILMPSMNFAGTRFGTGTTFGTPLPVTFRVSWSAAPVTTISECWENGRSIVSRCDLTVTPAL